MVLCKGDICDKNLGKNYVFIWQEKLKFILFLDRFTPVENFSLLVDFYSDQCVNTKGTYRHLKNLALSGVFFKWGGPDSLGI